MSMHMHMHIPLSLHTSVHTRSPPHLTHPPPAALRSSPHLSFPCCCHHPHHHHHPHHVPRHRCCPSPGCACATALLFSHSLSRSAPLRCSRPAVRPCAALTASLRFLLLPLLSVLPRSRTLCCCPAHPCHVRVAPLGLAFASGPHPPRRHLCSPPCACACCLFLPCRSLPFPSHPFRRISLLSCTLIIPVRTLLPFATAAPARPRNVPCRDCAVLRCATHPCLHPFARLLVPSVPFCHTHHPHTLTLHLSSTLASTGPRTAAHRSYRLLAAQFTPARGPTHPLARTLRRCRRNVCHRLASLCRHRNRFIISQCVALLIHAHVRAGPRPLVLRSHVLLWSVLV